MNKIGDDQDLSYRKTLEYLNKVKFPYQDPFIQDSIFSETLERELEILLVRGAYINTQIRFLERVGHYEGDEFKHIHLDIVQKVVLLYEELREIAKTREIISAQLKVFEFSIKEMVENKNE